MQIGGTVKLGEFEVKVRLATPYTGSAEKKADETNWTRTLDQLDILISRQEEIAPPDPVIKPDGIRDLGLRRQYLQERLPAYKETAINIANRFLCFFQYKLHTPLIRPISERELTFHNPTWYNNDGNELETNSIVIVPELLIGADGALSVSKLTPENMPSLLSFLAEPEQPPLSETLLSDAQSAWFEDNPRRSVLELAICTEVIVKRKFFAESSPAGAAFDYLEDKAKISVRILELLDKIALEAFSRSYRNDSPDDYRAIDHLFRCRNKIAHRGELAFRDDTGSLIQVDKALVATWWSSVINLKEWLASLS